MPGRAGYFYPREVADILEIPQIDYRQLRVLFKLARLQALRPIGDTDHRWSRYTLRDIAAVDEALQLAGGRPALLPGRKLRVAAVEAAVRALLQQGIRDPLLEVPMERHGSVVVAAVGGTLIDPASGQLIIRRIFADVSTRLEEPEPELLTRLRSERDRRLHQAQLRVNAYTALG